MHCIDAAQDCAKSVVTCEKLTMGPSSTFAACHTDVGSGRTQSQGYAIVSHPVHMRAHGFMKMREGGFGACTIVKNLPSSSSLHSDRARAH